MTEVSVHPKTLPTHLDDEVTLIVKARREPRAFTDVYHRYLNPVYYYLLSRVRDPHDAEDLTSQVFLEAFENLHAYRPVKPFAAWLFTIARRRAIDFYRRHRSEVSLNDDWDMVDPAADPHTAALESARLVDLARLIARLDGDEQEMLRLRFAAGLNFREISAVLKRKESAVKMAYYRLLARLEEQMDKEDA